ncbi:peptide/nickel transport system substrate-binding protein [Granulicella pectinivorans]|jgi:peptide/nickel transport system substrate-binding protein|uniref:Peptide/nickel transport system substrate-binding protein n=1 Tax=Granulicella pectinivorans TaxID=474950 RepID=A0A1I6M9S6_9BACT|nr:ABC transporter substrate-binding protein [Granulicella pectinivorans]SFS12476.1 peptide/nickel transport system substrate-binding protein [Granulicella pectinivorans]
MRLRVALLLPVLALAGCRARNEAPGSVVMAIESSPNNLDLRQGTDAQSERVGSLVFDALVVKDDHFVLQPWLATSWERPDAVTWVFHLRDGVRFHDGRPLEADDVAWTIRSLIDGTIVSSKSGNFAAVKSVETPDRLTVVVHTKYPFSGLLFNMSDGLFGVVPRGAGKDLGLHPIGSGPFRFVSAVQDKEVVLERSPLCWRAPAVPPPGKHLVDHVRFAVVPDTITTALEMKKGSADVVSNVVTLDMVHALEQAPNLSVATDESSIAIYMTLNVQDPVLRDKRVRQAMAFAMDKPAIIQALWRGQAKAASTLLPEGHWAAASAAELPQYPHNVARAQALLEAAGFHADKNGVRLRVTLKTSTDETTRLLAAVLQQQMRAAGIELTTRSAEFGTFYADITKGAFQMYILRWIGSNEDPDIFRYAYGTASFPPKGGNRGRYSNAKVDGLIAKAAAETDEGQRRADYVELQRIVAEELPVIPLWYPNNELVYGNRMGGMVVRGSGTFDFLRDAWTR